MALSWSKYLLGQCALEATYKKEEHRTHSTQQIMALLMPLAIPKT
jgi:hypothetical protein